MNLLFCMIQYLLGLLPLRHLAVVPVRSPRGRRAALAKAITFTEWMELGSLRHLPPQSVELGSHALARRLPGFASAQVLRAQRRRNQRNVYEPGRPGGAS